MTLGELVTLLEEIPYGENLPLTLTDGVNVHVVSRVIEEDGRVVIEIGVADTELEQLRRWKAEAIAVLNGWERVWEACGRPGPWGHSKSLAVLGYINGLRGHDHA